MTSKNYIIGFPRIGEQRELKIALEQYWAGNISAEVLRTTAFTLRKKHLQLQRDKGVYFISSNDFSYYDGMLDTAVMINAVPARFMVIKDELERYFAMARGSELLSALEMTKWFNTNYHYIVPELEDNISFKANPAKIITEYKEAAQLGIKTKINIIGPVTFCALSKNPSGEMGAFDFFGSVLQTYKEVFTKIAELDNEVYVQLEEPIFVKSDQTQYLPLLEHSLSELSSINDKIKIILTTYFEHAYEIANIIAESKVWGVALDFVYGPHNIDNLGALASKYVVAGVIDGRNVWRTDFDATLGILNKIAEKIPRDQIIVSTSCSLLHLPYTIHNEPETAVKKRLAFAYERIEELVLVSKLFCLELLSDRETGYLEASRDVISEIRNAEALPRIKAAVRKKKFEDRVKVQQRNLNIPELPTTTIGSFPQTRDLRKLRVKFRRGAISYKQYEAGIKQYIKACIAVQEEIGLDVLVHGEPERTDMVEYFGEKMEGFHFTINGWVQSYGSRCVKPPIIFDNVYRVVPMTVKWITYAQTLTEKPVKGMLTGPVTIINWSFVRTDISKLAVAMQIAESLTNEVDDLQNAGIKIIQIDEPALKEGYPLRIENIKDYENWAVQSFLHTASSANPETQIHTHMCYSYFNDIIKTIEAMDADVITIETARSGNKLLSIFNTIGYKKGIGPGLYDIHSPRIPSIDEFIKQINVRLEVIKKEQMWINPDCGLKTRQWKEVKLALINMIKATKSVRNLL